MLLSELIDIVITESGQFILGDDTREVLDCSNISIERFWIIAERALRYYEKHLPRKEKINIEVVGQVFEFDVGTNPVVNPTWVSTVRPVGLTQGVLLRENLFPTSSLQPRTMVWEHRGSILYVSEDGTMDVVLCYPYITVKTTVATMLTEVDIQGITLSNNKYIDLVVAEFLIALGRSRRAFNLQELPIEMDASTLVDEGLDLRERTREAITTTNDWFESVGV